MKDEDLCRSDLCAPAASSSDHGQASTQPIPLAVMHEFDSLHDRICRLEEDNARLQAVIDRIGTGHNAPADAAATAHGTTQSDRRRVSMASHAGVETSLARSSPAIGLLATFARADEDSNPSPLDSGRRPASRHDADGGILTIDSTTEEAFFDIYHDKVQCRYPFLRLDELRDADRRPSKPWIPYFVNMIFSIGLLLEKGTQLEASRPRHGHSHQAFYRAAVTRHLSHVFAQHDRLLHIQAYLLLAMHAIYSPSTERIISIASATMRYCVMAQLHLADTEPRDAAVSVAARVEAQMRRRVFWSAYALDRAVCTTFDLPFSVPDYQITARMYANVDDADLEARCGESLPEGDPAPPPRGRPGLTSVSAALHVVYCRQIQSEILNTTLHRDFDSQFDGLSHWRLRVLEKLERWRALCRRYSDARSRSFTSGEWMHMIYNYSLAMLYRPNRQTVAGPAGDWTVRSCVQACLIFRKFQRETPISELWLGLVAQFKCGVALLYCFFATPPRLRTAAYGLPDASEAVRACSIVLSILAERWPQSKCLRDAFDILAREIPLFEAAVTEEEEGVNPRKMKREPAEALMALISQLETIVVHRDTLRMIKEMASEEFPRSPSDEQQKAQNDMDILAETAAQLAEDDSPSWRTSITGDIFQPIAPHFFQPDMSGLDADGFDYTTLGFPGEFDLLEG
ncbi:fungal specific transcription factor domain-containing protein [Colletotrichum sojae]|uniref:Fungal specific transcription factor domain-containing protein n=1 Tax=Colletotrichum sojae TaxID=2175907 RepID=A0A8H6MRK3_9PEZI|nr:fungal specific transcription factor domain-containing protein [Colletotrichum sojae]